MKKSEGFCTRIKEYIKIPTDVRTVPVEYYTWNWFSFAHNTFKFSQLPSKVMLLDRSEQKLQGGSDKYISKIIEDTLEKSESALLSLLYRKQKEIFSSQESMQKINERLSENKAEITDREISVSIDISARSNWDSNLTLYIDDVPFRYIGKGEQGAIKTKLALQTKMEKSQIVMIEEPETNLSYTNLNKLVYSLVKACSEKQLIITTHSTFMMNKIGIDKVIFMSGYAIATMSGISDSTKQYFQKLPGYDTLRMIIANRSVLVEGRSDELIVQKAYHQLHKRLPLDDGIDIITVGGLAFKRFMEIAEKLNKQISVITDNDGDYEATKARYKAFDKSTNICLCIDDDIAYPTLEPQIVKVNNLAVLNTLFQKSFTTKEEMSEYMLKNKADCALQIFENIVMPKYILDAIR
ncbi:ATP-dependent nuclease [Desulfitobacterium sp.]|uniref:ATP-dependent nuclease n=1 Tax=Desulfitobacterium sp. TaxID=49981 RepID=UPI002D086A70|nr:TOPRIM nucleotidyl transferase/hydrolase domain-containing protein [Desulfitobacterium sp.]HVJ50702.1 TOPRIM nucleotidyl transferase/hydrolase domain-containing protein [Desulfitobacterium sp.]